MRPSSRNLLELNLWISRPRSVMALLGTCGQVHLDCRRDVGVIDRGAGTVRSIVRRSWPSPKVDPQQAEAGFFALEFRLSS